MLFGALGNKAEPKNRRDPSFAYMIRILPSGYNNHRNGSSGAERGGDLTVKIALEVPDEHSYVSMVRQIGRTLLEHH